MNKAELQMKAMAIRNGLSELLVMTNEIDAALAHLPAGERHENFTRVTNALRDSLHDAQSRVSRLEGRFKSLLTADDKPQLKHSLSHG